MVSPSVRLLFLVLGPSPNYEGDAGLRLSKSIEFSFMVIFVSLAEFLEVCTHVEGLQQGSGLVSSFPAKSSNWVAETRIYIRHGF